MNISLTHYHSGKVRDIYSVSESELLFVTSDRISAYDSILGQHIPDKGRILNQISLFWLDKLSHVVPNHFINEGNDKIDLLSNLYDSNWLQDRTMLVHRAEMIPIECIVRGYLAGSAWKEYKERGSISNIVLPENFRIAEKLPEPIFTPSTKAKKGHDENIDINQARYLVGSVIDDIKQISLELYYQAANYAESKGIIIADTKFEFGIVNGQITLADEVLSPDSSRFWYKDGWTPGESPFSLDKQFVRDWLDSSGWDHNPPPPKLPNDVIEITRSRYLDAYECLVQSPIL